MFLVGGWAAGADESMVDFGDGGGIGGYDHEVVEWEWVLLWGIL